MSTYLFGIADLGHYDLAERAFYSWVEATFGVRVYREVAEKLSTVRDLADYIDSQRR